MDNTISPLLASKLNSIKTTAHSNSQEQQPLKTNELQKDTFVNSKNKTIAITAGGSLVGGAMGALKAFLNSKESSESTLSHVTIKAFSKFLPDSSVKVSISKKYNA